MLHQPTLEQTDEQLVLPNLSIWIERYLNDCRQQLHKPVTVIHYGSALKRFAIWYETQLPDGRISKKNAKQFGYWLSFEKSRYDDHPGRPTETETLSKATVRRTIGVVRTFLRWLNREGYMNRNFADWFPLTPVGDLPKRIIETSTLLALFTGAASGELSVRDTTIIALLADTGLRREEVTRLTVGQVRFLDAQGTGYLHEVQGKFDKLRDVPFSPTVGKLLEHWIRYRARLANVEPKSGPLFVQPSGKRLRPVGLYQILRRCAKRGGVEEEVWNTHSLRHNFATNFWRIQRDTKSLSMILGHSGQKVTEDIYVHPIPADLIQSHTSVIATGAVGVPTLKVASNRHTPTKFLLTLAIEKTPNWRELAKQFQMSDVGVRKLAQRYGLLDLYYQSRGDG